MTLFYQPYFYVGLANDRFIPEITQLLQRKFDSIGMLCGATPASNSSDTVHVER